MKKVSAKVFFTILWRGIRQAAIWFVSQLRWKKNGKFFKYFWKSFTVCVALLLSILFVKMTYKGVLMIYHNYICDDFSSYEKISLYGDEVSYYKKGETGFVYNEKERCKTVKSIAWITCLDKEDSLLCFCDGSKRGYINRFTGEIVITPKYNHAWVFSEGLACVEENSLLKFINPKGEEVINKVIPYFPNHSHFLYHHGYYAVSDNEGKKYGMMDKKGNMVLDYEYDSFVCSGDSGFWCVEKDGQMAVLDKNLNVIFPFTKCKLYVTAEGMINVNMPDHTMRVYDGNGILVNDFCVVSVKKLEYEENTIEYMAKPYDDGGDFNYLEYHPKATARLRVYEAADKYKGLMTDAGEIVTMPIYTKIKAIDSDTYLCSLSGDEKVVVDGKGNPIKQMFHEKLE